MSRFRAASLALGLLVPTLCSAEHSAFRTPSLADMRRGAVDSTNITVGPLALWFADRVISNRDSQSAAVKSLLHGLHKVQVRSYEYNADHVYRQADLEALRSQLTKPGWHKIVKVRERDVGVDVAVHYTQDNRTVTGLVVLEAKPREFTLISISGTIDMRNVAALRGTFMPHKHGGSLLALSSQKPDGHTPLDSNGLDQPTNPVEPDVHSEQR